jgi:hypothetical protein
MRQNAAAGPRRDRHYSYNEGVDEPGRLIEDEPVEVEAEVPVDENEPAQQVEEGDEGDIPLEEG